MILYTDDTAEVENERAFKQVIAMREGELMAMQKVNTVIKQALAVIVMVLRNLLEQEEKVMEPKFLPSLVPFALHFCAPPG